jgi:glycerol kinase
MGKYILALDQGTTSSRAILFDRKQNIVGIAQKEFTQLYPQQGWVEHDPQELYSSQYAVMMEVITRSDIPAGDIAAIGITNQRETVVVWDRATGSAVCNAIVWQCRRTADLAAGLVEKGYGDYIYKATGLVPDAYFSASKIQWILDHVEGARDRARRGELLCGTVDSWLIWKLTNGKVHVTDYTNASRTMLYNIHTLDWDPKLLDLFDIPIQMLPRVCGSSEVYGTTVIQGHEVPIAGIAGDQQAALFGQCCFSPGEAKSTYGTGCFLLMNTGDQVVYSKSGLLSTIAIGIGDSVQYALEGSVFIGGAVIQWLRDELKLIHDAADAEYYASKLDGNGGVYMVPAFTGLGAPHWDMYARGCILGITRSTRREHIIRAAQESIAYQTNDLITAMERDASIPFHRLKVDGGASRDAFLMQFQADITNKEICRPRIRETTAMGAAFLAGLAVGFWGSQQELQLANETERVFTPDMAEEQRTALLHDWHRAVRRSLDWAGG